MMAKPLNEESEFDIIEDLSFDHFVVMASCNAIHCSDYQRLGQSYMDTLYRHRPDLYEEIIRTPLDKLGDVDPYNDDKKLPNFLAWVAENWDREGDLP